MDKNNQAAPGAASSGKRVGRPLAAILAVIIVLALTYVIYNGYQQAPSPAPKTTYYNATVNSSIGASVGFIYDTLVANSASASFFEPLFSPLLPAGKAVNAAYSGYLSVSGPNATNESIALNYQTLNGSEFINFTTAHAPTPAFTLFEYKINGTYYSCFASFGDCITKQANLVTATYFSGGIGSFSLVNGTASQIASVNGQSCSHVSGTFASSPNSTSPASGSFDYCFSQTYSVPVLISVSAALGSNRATLHLELTKVSGSASQSSFALPYKIK